MLPRHHPDRIRIAFDDHRLVANAGLILPATLARRLGLRELVDRHLDLGGAPGRANTGDKLLTLVASALAGGDCIDDADVLRTGRTARAIGCVVKAPSTLGQDDCKVSELDRRGGRWSALGGRRKSWLAGAWISGLETILPGAGPRRRAFRPVLTRVANISPSPGRRSVWTSSSQLRSFT